MKVPNQQKNKKSILKDISDKFPKKPSVSFINSIKGSNSKVLEKFPVKNSSSTQLKSQNAVSKIASCISFDRCSQCGLLKGKSSEHSLFSDKSQSHTSLASIKERVRRMTDEQLEEIIDQFDKECHDELLTQCNSFWFCEKCRKQQQLQVYNVAVNYDEKNGEKKEAETGAEETEIIHTEEVVKKTSKEIKAEKVDVDKLKSSNEDNKIKFELPTKKTAVDNRPREGVIDEKTLEKLRNFSPYGTLQNDFPRKDHQPPETEKFNATVKSEIMEITPPTIDEDEAAKSAVDDKNEPHNHVTNYCKKYKKVKYEIEVQNYIIDKLNRELKAKTKRCHSEGELKKLRCNLNMEISKLRAMIDYAVCEQQKNRDLEWGAIPIFVLDSCADFSAVPKCPSDISSSSLLLDKKIDKKCESDNQSMSITEIKLMNCKLLELRQLNSKLLKSLETGACEKNVNCMKLNFIKSTINNLITQLNTTKNVCDKMHTKIHLT